MRQVTRGLPLYVGIAASFLPVACGGEALQDDGGTLHGDGGSSGPDGTTVTDTGELHETETSTMEASALETGPVSSAYPAAHAPLPQATTFGGPIVVSPTIIPVTFPSDPNQSDIVTFTMGIGQTTYWSTIVAQYGIGAATMGTPVILSKEDEPVGTGETMSDADVQTWLQGLIQAGPLSGTNGVNTIYAIYFPAGTTITLQAAMGTATSCVQFAGYHNSTGLPPSGTSVTYAVIPRCTMFETMSGELLSGLDAITGPASHEYLEASTDPEPIFMPAYVEPDQNDIIWESVLGGGEIGDLCAQNPGAFYKPAGFDYTVQRAWSNSAAVAGRDPCEPELPGEVYFNSVAVLPSILVNYQQQSIMTDAVSIPVGSSRTLDVDLYSEGPTAGPWTVEAIDDQVQQGGPPALSFIWDATSGENGQTLHLTIEAVSKPPNGYDAFVILSELGAQTSLSIGMVVVE